MTYHWFKKKRSCKKAKERHSKEKAAEYYFKKPRSRKRKVKQIDTKTCQKNKYTILKSIEEKDIRKWFSTKKKYYKINDFSSV